MRKSKKVILVLLIIILAFWSFSCTKYLLERKSRKEHKDENELEIVQEEDVEAKSVKEEVETEESSEREEAPEEDKAASEDASEDKKGPEEEVQIPVSDSGIRICIDPGHYEGCNAFESNDGIYYCEGDIDLQIALELQRILKEKYGISSELTRTSGTININGYTDSVLDNGHISLRGEMAEGYDLFLSIHTNANVDGANGYPTYSQPVSINKPILIANQTACYTDDVLMIGNCIGKNLEKVNHEAGLSAADGFKEVLNAASLTEWTDEYNDGLGISGTICVRMGNHGDYYGVLRGAANVGVPGFIIEHGYHTVSEVRKQLIEGNLITQWAEADARGIAEGFHLIL